MNSLPLIPHHLFVAAIANDGRVCQRPNRPELRSVGLAEAANTIKLEVMDGRNPMPTGVTPSLRASVNQARRWPPGEAAAGRDRMFGWNLAH